MASRSFKQKQYGKVKPVKQKVEKIPKPDVRELKRIYKSIAKQGVWTKLDTICLAMSWWDDALPWMRAQKTFSLKAKLVAEGLSLRKQGWACSTENAKIDNFIKASKVFQKASLGMLKVPAIEVSIKLGDKVAKKHNAVKDNMADKYSKLTDILAAVFPSCTIAVEVVPTIIDPLTGDKLPKKIDHTKDKIYYSREYAKYAIARWRSQGFMFVVIDEAFTLSRAMSFPKVNDGSFKVDPALWVRNYQRLLNDFAVWAAKADTPKRLVKKAKIAKITIKNNHKRTTKKVTLVQQPFSEELPEEE